MTNGDMNNLLYKSAVSGSAFLTIASSLLLTSTDEEKPYLLSNPIVLSMLLAGSAFALIASVRYSYSRGHRMRHIWKSYSNNNSQGSLQDLTPPPFQAATENELGEKQRDGLVAAFIAALLFIATAAYAIDIGSDSLESDLDKGIFGILFGFVGIIGVAMLGETSYTMQCNDSKYAQPRSNVLAEFPDTVYTMSVPEEYSEYGHGALYSMRVGSGLLGAVSLMALYVAALNPSDASAPMMDGVEPAVYRLFFAGALFLAWGIHQYSYVLRESKQHLDEHADETSTKKTSFLGSSSLSFGMSAACFAGMIIVAMAKKMAQSEPGIGPELAEITSFAGVYGLGGGVLLTGVLFMAHHSYERAKDVPAAQRTMSIN